MRQAQFRILKRAAKFGFIGEASVREWLHLNFMNIQTELSAQKF
jgi:hypothetical protein